MTKSRIETTGLHALLHCETATYVTPPDEAEVKWGDPHGPDNTRWVPHTFDLTVNRPRDWTGYHRMPEHVNVEFEDGAVAVLRMTYEAFDAMYREWLAAQPRWPELN